MFKQLLFIAIKNIKKISKTHLIIVITEFFRPKK